MSLLARRLPAARCALRLYPRTPARVSVRLESNGAFPPPPPPAVIASTDAPGSVLTRIEKSGLNDVPPGDATNVRDWARSFHGLSDDPFPKEVTDVLLADINPDDIEIKPDGIIFLPEIKYRRILNRAFGPGGWGLAPRGETIVTDRLVTREYALVCFGRLVSIARGEQEYFDVNGISMATEGCKSNALMRTCKDLGIASELWDPRFIRRFKRDHCVEKFGEHAATKKKKKIWLRKGDNLEYPWKATSFS